MVQYVSLTILVLWCRWGDRAGVKVGVFVNRLWCASQCEPDVLPIWHTWWSHQGGIQTEGGQTFQEVCYVVLDQPFKALYHNGKECYRVVVTKCWCWGPGSGMIAVVQITMACFREVFQMFVRMRVSWSAQCLKTHPGMLSGLVAFWGLTLCRVFQTSGGSRKSISYFRMGGAYIVVVLLFSSNQLK